MAVVQEVARLSSPTPPTAVLAASKLPLRVVQSRLGHATIAMTADRYGHLFPRGDDGAEMAAAEQAIMALT
jgi:integrase